MENTQCSSGEAPLCCYRSVLITFAVRQLKLLVGTDVHSESHGVSATSMWPVRTGKWLSPPDPLALAHSAYPGPLAQATGTLWREVLIGFLDIAPSQACLWARESMSLGHSGIHLVSGRHELKEIS